MKLGIHDMLSLMPEDKMRRPLKSRESNWSKVFLRFLLKCGVRPNAVSVASVAFALAACFCMATAGHGSKYSAWLWLAAAACIQLRLLCNLMDGLLAVEGGLKSYLGDLYNEIPDRFADVFIIVGFGYAYQNTPHVLELSWACGCLSLLTAYIRAQGAALTKEHDYCGPFAKQHRMAYMTGLCIISCGFSLMHAKFPYAQEVMIILAVGIFITACRRVLRLAKKLKMKAHA